MSMLILKQDLQKCSNIFGIGLLSICEMNVLFRPLLFRNVQFILMGKIPIYARIFILVIAS